MMTEETRALTDLCAEYKIKIQSMKLNARPDGSWTEDRNAGHFFVRIYSDDRTAEITGFYSQGSGHRVKRGGKMVHPHPKVADVLGAFLMDASCADEGFEDWADNLGYDQDSIKARETYQACQKSRAMVEAFLMEDLDLFLSAEH